MITPELMRTDGNLLDDLIEKIYAARSRVFLETMSIDAEGRMSEVFESISSAAKIGAEVCLIYDRYSIFDTYVKEGRGSVRKLRANLARLYDAGVDVRPVGAIGLNPFAGRNHIKTYIADDVVYTAGGANLTGDTFEKTHDFMLRYNDGKLADKLIEPLKDVAISRTAEKVIEIDNENTFIIDGGQRGMSRIYDRAIELAKSASTLYISSKMIPSGALKEEILKKSSYRCLYNRVEDVGIFDKAAIMFEKLRGNSLVNTYGAEGQLHAKFIIAEHADGSMEALTGSHNFSALGVRFGTQEMALHTKDQAVCNLLKQFFESLRQ